jgi:hypothetical protein
MRLGCAASSDSVLDQVVARLREARALVVVAPPGDDLVEDRIDREPNHCVPLMVEEPGGFVMDGPAPRIHHAGKVVSCTRDSEEE